MVVVAIAYMAFGPGARWFSDESLFFRGPWGLVGLHSNVYHGRIGLLRDREGFFISSYLDRIFGISLFTFSASKMRASFHFDHGVEQACLLSMINFVGCLCNIERLRVIVEVPYAGVSLQVLSLVCVECVVPCFNVDIYLPNLEVLSLVCVRHEGGTLISHYLVLKDLTKNLKLNIATCIRTTTQKTGSGGCIVLHLNNTALELEATAMPSLIAANIKFGNFGHGVEQICLLSMINFVGCLCNIESLGVTVPLPSKIISIPRKHESASNSSRVQLSNLGIDIILEGSCK
ncbi:3-phosphoshikimate 1-carboxyvinyltransferase [Striga asiatica]|uniref:3-phosphoshikimate 1-carboxyvinyltransferase n=1 Tax=Striga asiatica TaxID=4170 RepID=A0A5A7QPJ5_STRAF|nr:3-phosphoshikimate 1-carboxyvinyltransferase [Striga asiatica]